MASNQLIALLVVTLLLQGYNNTVVEAQLRANFYSASCPRLHSIVRTTVSKEVTKEPRMGASLLRLLYLDCFVRGCDGSILLYDTPGFMGERSALPNLNSARGFDVIDNIKSMVEAACPGVVSCADILAIAAKDSVELLGGPSWQLRLGRRDSRIAMMEEVMSNIPPPFPSVSLLSSMFQAKGLTTRDLVALSGAHTIGQSRCVHFQERIYNDTNIDPAFATERQRNCPRNSGYENLAPLDSLTPITFDNSYFKNLIAKKGLLPSDQELLNDVSTSSLVRLYSTIPGVFRRHFAETMRRMSEISPLTGSDGEIRKSCGMIN